MSRMADPEGLRREVDKESQYIQDLLFSVTQLKLAGTRLQHPLCDTDKWHAYR